MGTFGVTGLCLKVSEGLRLELCKPIRMLPTDVAGQLYEHGT